jgi:ABC-type multidrug transport system fused ATPase/permease subunit
MIDLSGVRKIWSLLDRTERRNALIVLALLIVAALAAAFMVGSVVPFLTILSNPARIEQVGPLNWAYETFGFQSNYSFLVAVGVVTLGVILLSNLLQLLRVYAITRFSQKRIHSLSRKLMSLYLHQPYEFFLDRHSGDMSTRILSETNQVIDTYLTPLANLVASLLTITALLGLLMWVNPVVALGVFAGFGAVYASVYFLVRMRLGRLGPIRMAANQERFKSAREVFGGIKEVKLHGRELTYLSRFSASSHRMVRASITAKLIGDLPSQVIQTVTMGAIILICLVLLDPVALDEGNGMTELVPLLGVIAFAAQRMKPEFGRIYGSMTRMKFGANVVDTIHEEFQKDRSVRLSGRAEAPAPLGLARMLEFDGVTYRYPNAAENSLSDVTLTITAGQRIGIVGSTGAGKTTLADMALGLLHPTSGQVRADGVEITPATLRAWQAGVAYVPQDIFLLDASIFENIAFGVPRDQIDEDRAREIARIAQLDGFVCSDLPKGYETTVGERGVRLSGGQRQRIGIARALYHNADLIVFDEATSALDNVTEREVMGAVDALPGDKTVLMIAHRLSTVKTCDRIIVLDRGRIVGDGPWSDLMAHNDAFRRIAEAA